MLTRWLAGASRTGITAVGPRPCPGSARASPSRLVVSAFAHQHRHSYSERILRYPDGRERRIIYPTDDATAAESEDDIVISGDIYRSFAEELQPDRWTSSAEVCPFTSLWCTPCRALECARTSCVNSTLAYLRTCT
jgi:hypothetical protein